MLAHSSWAVALQLGEQEQHLRGDLAITYTCGGAKDQGPYSLLGLLCLVVVLMFGGKKTAGCPGAMTQSHAMALSGFSDTRQATNCLLQDRLRTCPGLGE